MAVAGPGWAKMPRPSVGRRTTGSGTPGYLPPGWPEVVLPPGADDWEKSASAFLLDCCPPDYRLFPILRRYPVVLARFAAESVDAQLAACEAGMGQCRASLGDFVPPEALDQAAQAWSVAEAGWRRMRREVGLVEEALRGGVFIRKL